MHPRSLARSAPPATMQHRPAGPVDSRVSSSRVPNRSRVAGAVSAWSSGRTCVLWIGVIGIERVDFVSVATRDLARPRRFYGELLGLPRSPTNPDEFEAANVTLTLWEPATQNVPFAPNRSGVALRVPDVNAAREQLAAKGVEFLGDTVDTGVCLMGFFSDPDGNVLILHRRYAPPGG